MIVAIATAEHEVAYADLVALVQRHSSKLSAAEVLAIAANMVGKLIAMQDQRTMTPGIAMAIVTANVEAGNRQVLEALAQAPGGTA